MIIWPSASSRLFCPQARRFRLVAVSRLGGRQATFGSVDDHIPSSFCAAQRYSFSQSCPCTGSDSHAEPLPAEPRAPPIHICRRPRAALADVDCSIIAISAIIPARMPRPVSAFRAARADSELGDVSWRRRHWAFCRDAERAAMPVICQAPMRGVISAGVYWRRVMQASIITYYRS